MQNSYIRRSLTLLLVFLLVSALLFPAFAVDAPTETADAIPTESPTEDPAAETTVSAPASSDIVSIDIERSGNDTYYEGEYFDPTMYVIRATRADGTSLYLTFGEFDYEPKGRLVTDGKSEDVTVEFIYGGKVKKTYVTVKRPTSARIIAQPVKMQYNEGSPFNPAGLMLELTYADGSVRFPESDEIKVNCPEVLTSDVTDVEIECYGAKTQLTGITVIKLVSMMITQPAKTVYYEGERFDPTDMLIIGTYENSAEGRFLDISECKVSASLENLAPNSSDRTKLTLTFSVGNVSQTLVLTVYGFESFRITPPVKTDYYYGEAFSRTGFSVKARYVNGDERDITDDITLTAPEIMGPGSEVRIRYLAYEETLLAVHEMRVLHFKTLPSVRTFKEGDLLTSGVLSDMLITAEYDDGTEVPLDPALYTISPASPLTISDTSFTVSYLGLSASAGITVLPARAISRIEITHAPEITSYISNQSVDISGMVVTAVYEDGTRETIPHDKLKITPAPGSPVKVTDTHIKIVYQLSENLVYTARQTIEVSPKKVISLSIVTPPSKLIYVEGEKFDTTGMVILAVYNDGTSAEITTYTCSPDSPLTLSSHETEETVSITVSYVDCTATQNITVRERAVKEIEIAQNPTRLEYSPGEKFDPAGMIIKITYENGESVLIEDVKDVITFTPDGALTESVTEVTVTFRGKSLRLPITVCEHAETTVAGGDATEPETRPETVPGTGPADVTTLDPGQITTTHGFDTIMVVWIAIIAVIVILLVVLIVYYKRNFT